VTDEELDELVAQVQAGDSDAFNELVYAIRKELRIFISAHAYSADMVEEVLQATLVVCYEKIHKYELRGTFLCWVKGIARNLNFKELSSRSRYLNAKDDFLDRLVLDSALETFGGAQDRAEEWVERLKVCIGKLPADSRAMIEKRYFENMSIRTLAQVLEKPESWTAVNLYRIREILRKCMMGEVAK
jgi:RNA polymerase sigma-70 factor (ECF subfamily)